MHGLAADAHVGISGFCCVFFVVFLRGLLMKLISSPVERLV